MKSREKILSAAIEIFAQKGKHGTRMEEIAKKAGVNKSVVYYYYTSKENLYREVLKKINSVHFKYVLSEIEKIWSEKEDPIKSVELIIRAYAKVFSENPSYTRIIINALANEPEDLQYAIRLLKAELDFMPSEELLDFFEDGIAKKAYRNIDVRQTIISIIGVTMIYFIVKPLIEIMLGLDLEDEDLILNERQESLVDLMLYGIVNKSE